MTPTDEEILMIVGSSNTPPTYYIKNVLRRMGFNCKTPYVLRRMKSLEAQGKVVRGSCTSTCFMWKLPVKGAHSAEGGSDA